MSRQVSVRILQTYPTTLRIYISLYPIFIDIYGIHVEHGIAHDTNSLNPLVSLEGVYAATCPIHAYGHGICLLFFCCLTYPL